MRLALAVLLGVIAVGCGGTEAETGYFGTFRVTREATSHVRSDTNDVTVTVEPGASSGELKITDSAGCVVLATAKDLHGELGASFTLHDATCASLDGWTLDSGGLLFATCPGYATCSGDYAGPRLEMRAVGTYDKQAAQVYWTGTK